MKKQRGEQLYANDPSFSGTTSAKSLHIILFSVSIFHIEIFSCLSDFLASTVNPWWSQSRISPSPLKFTLDLSPRHHRIRACSRNQRIRSSPFSSCSVLWKVRYRGNACSRCISPSSRWYLILGGWPKMGVVRLSSFPSWKSNGSLFGEWLSKF